MATLYERILGLADYDTDGGGIDRTQLDVALHMWDNGNLTTANFKTMFGCTTPQAADVDDVFATRPAALLTVLNAVNRARWCDSVMANVVDAQNGYSAGTLTGAQLKTRLGA